MRDKESREESMIMTGSPMVKDCYKPGPLQSIFNTIVLVADWWGSRHYHQDSWQN